MSAFIDIVRIINKDGISDLVEIGYTLDACINKGWMDTKGIWIRKEVNVRAYCDEDERPDGPDSYPDPLYGQDMKLNLEKINGKWMHKVDKDFYFK